MRPAGTASWTLSDAWRLPARLKAAAGALLPGVLIAGLVAVAAQFMSEHYGAPAMLVALLLGMALNFLSEPGTPTAAGIAFTARDVLKFGVVLLGTRISLDLIAGLGWQMFALVVLATAATLVFGALAGRLFRKTAGFSVLTAGAVAICGASAALAIHAVLPGSQRSDEQLTFTVLMVTLLSTIAMIVYPPALLAAGFADAKAGAFIGATIHDVAQVVGAGFLISEEAGKAATLVKLTRVALLAPVVVILALLMRAGAAAGEGESVRRPPLLPPFMAGFLILAALSSFGLISPGLRDAAILVSQWALLSAIAAVGLKSSLRSVTMLGPLAAGLVVAETLFLAGFVFLGLAITG